MKRTIFIIGIVIIFILTGVLLFLLFANETTKNDVFNRFGLSGTTEEGGLVDTLIDTILPGDTNRDPLRQLSMRRVIGATEVAAATSSTPIVYFAEAGTGHIYALDTLSGEESRLSNITIPTSQEAAFTTDGATAVIAAAARTSGKKITIITLPHASSSLSSFEVTRMVQEFSLTENATLFYSALEAGTLTGYSFNLLTNTESVIFTLPFTEARILWGKKSTDPIFVYPKSAAQLEGYLYRVSGGVIDRLPIEGFGLSAIASNTHILSTYHKNGTYKTSLYNLTSEYPASLLDSYLPEKCSFLLNGYEAICGRSTFDHPETLPDSWYMGITSFSDNLWLIDLDTQESTMLLEVLPVALRELDVTKPNISSDGNRFYFTNKNDESLWILDRTLLSQ